MTVIRIVGPKCTLVASLAASGESRWVYRPDRRTDARPLRYAFLKTRPAYSKYCLNAGKQGHSSTLAIVRELQMEGEMILSSRMWQRKKVFRSLILLLYIIEGASVFVRCSVLTLLTRFALHRFWDIVTYMV